MISVAKILSVDVLSISAFLFRIPVGEVRFLGLSTLISHVLISILRS